MIKEFNRYKLTNSQRKLTGVLQIIGALGLLGSFYTLVLGVAAAAGLSVLMLLGFIVRLRIKDSFFQSLPSFLFMLINAYLCYRFLLQL